MAQPKSNVGRAVDTGRPAAAVVGMQQIERRPRIATLGNAQPAVVVSGVQDEGETIMDCRDETQRARKAAIEALEGLTVEQHVSWKKAVDRIKKLLEE